jgi:hypothetical protein
MLMRAGVMGLPVMLAGCGTSQPAAAPHAMAVLYGSARRYQQIVAARNMSAMRRR